MPITPTYPGVYIEEIPSGVRTIAAVATSIAAFIDYFPRGPMNQAVEILSYADFERTFGGLDVNSEASYAIQQFFLNGGTDAWVVRVASAPPAPGLPPTPATVDIDDPSPALSLVVQAASEGQWGNDLRVTVAWPAAGVFNLAIFEVDPVSSAVLAQESFLGLDVGDVQQVLLQGSQLVVIPASSTPGPNPPAPSGTTSTDLTPTPGTPVVAAPAAPNLIQLNVTFTPGITKTLDLGTAAIDTLDEVAGFLQAAIRGANPQDPGWSLATVSVVAGPTVAGASALQVSAGIASPNVVISFADTGATSTASALGLVSPFAANVAAYTLGGGADGVPPNATDLIGNPAAIPPTGIYALEKVSLFNILCLPRIARLDGPNAFDPNAVITVVSTATAYCDNRRAFLILDTPSNVATLPQVKSWLAANASLRDNNVAFYFPRVEIADPLNAFRPRSFGASGTLAGLYARTDAGRGVWKAPAGTDAVLRGIQSLDYVMTDAENGVLNPLAIDCLRNFPVYGNVCWGARTLNGSDQQASDWKYIPVRRLALFIEESLYRGTQWVVFEPNDEPLWSQIRLNVGAFMHDLFRQGAFQGASPREAYLVKCDRETTTQTDIDNGIVNIVVGFAPLKPAEFVIIKIQQLAGQIQT